VLAITVRIPDGPHVSLSSFLLSLLAWGEPLASPANELFYEGKLLPLHLPPRIQMVEELLDGYDDEARRFRGALGGGFSTTPATPYESCNASPANSCYVSGELNVEEYFQEYMAGLAEAAAAAGERKPWSRKLKFMRQLNLGLKLKASKAYLLKTIFSTKAGNQDGKNILERQGESRSKPTAMATSGRGGRTRSARSKATGASPRTAPAVTAAATVLHPRQSGTGRASTVRPCGAEGIGKRARSAAPPRVRLATVPPRRARAASRLPQARPIVEGAGSRGAGRGAPEAAPLEEGRSRGRVVEAAAASDRGGREEARRRPPLCLHVLQKGILVISRCGAHASNGGI